jgi:hypothetical protein
MLRIKGSLRHFSFLIINHAIFEALIIMVIIANTITLAMEDPTLSEQSPELQIMENVFLFIYTVECGMKILALGFLFGQQAYLREKWNMLDFAIVVSGWIAYLASGGVNLSALRSLRILRPLRSISSIKGLKSLFLSLVEAVPLLIDNIIVLLFFFLIFAIAGLQLWMGFLRYRCMDLQFGFVKGADEVCGYRDCDNGDICVESLENINYDITSFDNILYAMLVVFQCVTLEGWTHIMVAMEKAYSPFVVLYFVPLVFIGAFFLLNLTLAVIKSSFSLI